MTQVRCEHCRGSGLIDKPGPDDDELLSRVVLSTIAIDELRSLNAELLAAAKAAQEFMGGFFGDQEMEANEITPVRKQLADAIAKTEGRS